MHFAIRYHWFDTTPGVSRHDLQNTGDTALLFCVVREKVKGKERHPSNGRG